MYSKILAVVLPKPIPYTAHEVDEVQQLKAISHGSREHCAPRRVTEPVKVQAHSSTLSNLRCDNCEDSRVSQSKDRFVSHQDHLKSQQHWR